jgi:hypothetical protein
VIDLDRDELLLVEADDSELAAWLEARSPELRTLVLERDPMFSSVVVPAAVEPYPERPVMLNTGGSRTEFASVAVPGLAEPADERLGAGVSGADVLGAAAGRATVLVAGHQLPIEALAVRETMRDPQGMVGAGDLRGTVLTVGEDLRRPVVWQVPQP